MQSFLFSQMFLHKLPHRKCCIHRPSSWHESKLFISDSCFFSQGSFPKSSQYVTLIVSPGNCHNPVCLHSLYQYVHSHYLSIPLVFSHDPISFALYHTTVKSIPSSPKHFYPSTATPPIPAAYPFLVRDTATLTSFLLTPCGVYFHSAFYQNSPSIFI